MAPVPTLHFGPFALDGTDDGLWRGPERCKLTAKAEAVLRYLVAHPGRLVRKADLLATVWPDVHVSDWVLTTCIREIRHVLGDVAKAPQYIATVHRQGYRFIAPVMVVATPPPLSVPAVPLPPPRAAPPAGEVLQSAPTAAALEEEHKLVTILCGALAEAPALAARLGPERWYRLLQTVVGLLQEVLQHYAGTLTLATNDGFTAVFGAPVAQEDHARRAVLAALELRQRLQDAPALHTQLTGGVLSLGMGLHSGLVVVGRLGQAPQRLATAVGAPFHIAARLQQQTAPGTILLSAATYHLVHAEVRATLYGALDMDGQSTPVAVYAVQGLLRRHAGVAGRGPRAVSPFVGRERELALLRDYLAVARGGQGQVVGLVGAPGIGKTRLLTEFCRRVPGNQVTVYEGRCLSYGQGTPYLPVRDLVRQVCGLMEAGMAEHTAAVQQRLHASGMTAQDDVALLQLLLDLPVAPECLARLSPEARQVRTFALLRHLILDAAQRQPLILVMENLHWIDPTSEAWLASLVERLPEAAVLLLGTYRPGYQPAWGGHAAVTQVAVPSLRAQDSRTVVQAVLGAVSLPEARLGAMVAQAEGNPFFLEELAWHVVEQGGQDTPGAVPETVHAVLAARLDRLPLEAKQLLQTAAVVGPEVPVPLLQAIAELPEAALHRGLAHVQAAEFLYETQLFPEQVYTFKHALTHEVVYGSLLQVRRRSLHARIVDVLEALTPDRLAEQVDRLAHHAVRGEIWDKAVTYCRLAGVRAVARSANREAVAYFEQALETLAQLPECRDSLVQAIDLRLNLHTPLRPLGENARILDLLRVAEALAERLDDPQRLGQIACNLCFYFAIMGEYDRALAAGQRALALATTSGAFDVQLLAQTNLGLAYSAVGDFGQTLDVSRRVMGLLSGERRYARSGQIGLPFGVISRGHVAWSLAEMGGFAEGSGVGEEAVQIAEAVEQPYSMAIALMWVGLLYCRQGVLHQAIPVLERGLALCQTANSPFFFPLIASVLGTAYALAGQAAEALPLLEQLLERAASGGRMFAHELVLTELSEACLLVGRVDEASALAGRLRDLSHTHTGHGYQAHACRLLGDVAMRRDPPDIDQATAHYRQALVLAEDVGMRPLQAHCHLGLGTLYATTGQREQARAALSTAIEMYRAMAMTLWLSQAEAALVQIGEVEGPAGGVP